MISGGSALRCTFLILFGLCRRDADYKLSFLEILTSGPQLLSFENIPISYSHQAGCSRHLHHKNDLSLPLLPLTNMYSTPRGSFRFLFSHSHSHFLINTSSPFPQHLHSCFLFLRVQFIPCSLCSYYHHHHYPTHARTTFTFHSVTVTASPTIAVPFYLLRFRHGSSLFLEKVQAVRYPPSCSPI